MLYYMFLLQEVIYRNCTRYENNTIIECFNLTWDPNMAQVPCSLLPPKFSQCITHSFDKFVDEFKPFNLPKNGCPDGNSNEYSLGMAVCTPLEGITCIGEKYWINTSYPCFIPGEYNLPKALILSFCLGMFGADRFYLGHYTIGFFKLCTMGFFFIFHIADFILLALGVVGPKSGVFSNES